MSQPNKSLGQHWLKDDAILRAIADYAKLTSTDTVLEIGPGLGTLTKILTENSKEVVAVEFDKELAESLSERVSAKNLEIVNADFLQFDLNQLPKDYKVVANVPYYITAKIVQKLLTADNKPSVIVLLVQKEVAERLAAKPSEMSILSISAQLFAEVSLGIEVPAKFFTPPPKVDSQVVIMKLRDKPLFENLDEKLFFRIVKAGFSARRKKLRTSLAGGLGLSKPDAENLLIKANIDPNLRAQDLSLDNWYSLTKAHNQTK
ncbi:16S rRNA (adenine(1518)-N(6)/adenine(1519)-N(6))-dimethyltransferase RsmA [Candidatus Saccharibacteria bacterium]|nr:16S rRNA (adenine(1518)-N(6)/adenine(1519)-N(6))-dimethyltransferase RsmA [Candidatus Saccharibacteria bacterium]